MATDKIRNGWFWFCPVIFDTETNELFPRYYGGIWFMLFDITLFLHHSMLVIADFIGIDIDKSYPIKLVK